MLYCAVIGDIVASRKISNRVEAQNKFNQILNEVNEKYNIYIASKFTITLGDEFQGLLNDASYCFDIIKYIKDKMSPIELVFGIGLGSMSTNFNPEISIGSDGPVYHNARNAVSRAKKKKPSICISSKSTSDELINSLINLIETCSKKRSSRQIIAIELYRKYGSQEEVANKLGLSQSTVSSLLNNALYYEIKNAEDSINEFLKNYRSHDL